MLVVEDHDQMRAMLVEMIRRLDDFALHGTAASVDDAVDLVGEPGQTDGPDVVMLDLTITGGSGVEVIAAVRSLRPSLPCLVLSGHREPHHVNTALSAGAAGYLVKGYPEELRQALRTVAAGGHYLSAVLRGDPAIDQISGDRC